MKDKSIEVINDFLENKKIHRAMEQVYHYLQVIGKGYYSYLVEHLILIDSINKDYERSLTIFRMIIKDQYHFNIKNYIKRFNESLSKIDFDSARLYLNIIAFYGDSEVAKLLDEKLDEVERKVLKPENEENDVIAVRRELYDYNNILLKTKGMILLENVDAYKMTIYKLLKISNMAIIPLENGKVVLQYQSDKKIKSVKEMRKARNTAYENKEYQKCIQISNKLLIKGDIDEYNYARMGMSYLKLGHQDKAIPYLIIATEMTMIKKKKHIDYSDLIAKLQGRTSPNGYKPSFIMKDSSFKTENFGIRDIDVIVDLLIDGISLDEICDKLQLSSEQLLLVKLNIARSYYAAGDDLMGDKIVLEVEKTKNKTARVRKCINIIRQNSKFYRNRFSNRDKKLVMHLQNQGI